MFFKEQNRTPDIRGAFFIPALLLFYYCGFFLIIHR